MRSVFVWLLLAVGVETSCQDRIINGLVFNPGKQPLQGVTVTLRSVDSSRIAAFAITRKDGSFKLGPVPTLNDKYVIDFRHIGFVQKTISFPDPVNSWPQELKVELAEKHTELKEILIKRELPVLIRSDTVVFNANSYRGPDVRKVEDLLKKMQGFSVDPSGRLSFNGKPVEKVLIDGDDLAADGYRMITKNLNAITIDKVEVIDNFSDNRLLRKVVSSDKVGVNLKISSRFKSKLSGSVEGGLAFEGRYSADMNGIYISKGSKWLMFGNYNNIARDVSGNAKYYYQQEGGLISTEDGSPVGAAVLENGTVLMPAIGDRYTRDNKDLGLAVMNSWKMGKYSRVNGMIGYDDLRQVNDASNSVITRISDLEQWSIFNNMHLNTKSRDLVARFSIHRDPGKKQVSRVDLIINSGKQENAFSGISTGDVKDSLAEKLKNHIKAFRLKGQQTWLMKNKVLQVNLLFDHGRLDEDLQIGSSRFLSYWQLDSTYTHNQQLLEKLTSRQQLHVNVNGKNLRLQYEYGLISEYASIKFDPQASISSIDTKPPFFPALQDLEIKTYSYKGTFRFLFDAGRKGLFGITGNSGLASIAEDGGATSLFVYETGFGYTKKFDLMNSFRLNYKVSRGFKKIDLLYPDQLMSGNATILNGLNFSKPELTHGLVTSVNGINISKQRTWSANLSYIIMPQRYINGVEVYPQYSNQFFELSGFSRMLNISVNGEVFIRGLRSKLGGTAGFYSGRDKNSVNDVKGISARNSLKMESWWITGFRLPVNAELRVGTNYSDGSWNGEQSNTVWQYYWSYKLKLRFGNSFYSSAVWNGQKLFGQKAFHGLDLFSSYKLNSSMQLSLNGVNLLNIGRMVDVAVMPYSKSENVYLLVGRYLLASLSWIF